MKHLIWTCCLTILMSDGWVFGQGTAQISGTVKDQSGAVLPGVQVTAIQTETGISRNTVTNETGSYVLPNLSLGPYRLEVALAGFRTYVQTGIVLQVDTNAVINPALEVGQVTEQVEVQGDTSLVETRATAISQVVENQRIVELPLNGRNPVELIVLAGGAVNQTTTTTGTFVGSQGSRIVSVAGGQGFGTTYLLDGTVHNNPYDNLNLPLPFPDALQEFRVETSALQAQAGLHSGAAVNAVTKSGTNTLHGNVFEFLRDRRFNATNPFALKRADGKRQDDGLNRNQFGGTLGGPIRRDKLFFFGGYQGTRVRQVPTSNIAFIPTRAMLNGDFTAFGSAACNGGRQISLKGPFVDNHIDPALLDRAALAIAGELPTTDDPCGRINYSLPSPQDEKQAVGKIDYQLSSNHSMLGRYMFTKFYNPPTYGISSDNILTSTQTSQNNLAQSFTYGDTYVFSPTALNTLRLAYNRTAIFRTLSDTFSAPSVGINTYSYLPKQIILIVNNAFNIGGGSAAARFFTNTFQLSDDITLVRRNHQLAVGGIAAKWNSISSANIRSPGEFTFDGQVTGLALADFLTGSLGQFRQTSPNTLDMSQWYGGIYAQDSWRVSSRINLNYGIRWEPFIPQVVNNGYVFNFSVDKYRQGIKSAVFLNAPTGFSYPGDDGFIGKSGMEKHWAKFSPRLGLAWALTGDGHTSIRTSYGSSNDFVVGRYLINTSLASPWGTEVILPAPAGGFQDPFRGFPRGNPFPTPVPVAANAPFPTAGQYLAPQAHLRNPVVHAWNLSFQRQFGADWAASITYLGNRANHLWNVLALNSAVYMSGSPCTLPDGRTYNPCSTVANTNSRRILSIENWQQGQFIGALDVHDDSAWQTYHGLMIAFQRRATSGLSLNGNYTLSRCIGLPTLGGAVPNAGQGYVDPNNLDYDKGNCDLNRTHIANLTVNYQTPKFVRGFVGVLASNWRASTIIRASSGSWMNITVTGDPARSGNQTAGQRPNKLLDDPYGDRTVDNYLNPLAFGQPALGTFGNLPRNAVAGPAQVTVDASLVREFRLGESQRLEARIEAFNLPNRFQKNNPVINLNSPTFGKILSAGDPRIMQFALKYVF